MTQIDPFDDWVEAYINSLHWSFGTSDYEKTLVAGNLRGMAAWINANLLKPAMEPRIVYVVGDMQPDGTWGCVGVFSTEEQACRCCIDHDNYFVGPIMGDTFHEADDDWPKAQTEWPRQRPWRLPGHGRKGPESKNFPVNGPGRGVIG